MSELPNQPARAFTEKFTSRHITFETFVEPSDRPFFSIDSLTTQECAAENDEILA